jgi:hypothetical protein
VPWTAAARGPRQEYVEVELFHQFEARKVGLAVARAREQRGDPFAVVYLDRVRAEQAAMLTGVPKERGRPARVARDRDHLEVVIEPVALAKVPSTGHVSDTVARSFSWQKSGAPKGAATSA